MVYRISGFWVEIIKKFLFHELEFIKCKIQVIGVGVVQKIYPLRFF